MDKRRDDVYPLALLYMFKAGMIWEAVVGFHPASLSVDHLMSKQVGAGSDYWEYSSGMQNVSWLSL